MRQAGGAYGYINYVHSTPAMNFSVGGGVNKLTIDSNGDVGIGTTNPTAGYRLHASGDAKFNGNLFLDNRGNRADSTQDTVQDTQITFYAGSAAAWNGFFIKYVRVAGPGTAPADRFVFQDGGLRQALTVYNGGKVAAGGDWTNGHPEAAFCVSGDASITGQLVVGGGQTSESIKLLRQSDTSRFISWYSRKIPFT